MKIKGPQKNMLGLRLVGEEESGNAFSLYGPKRAGLTTTPRIQNQALSESLKSLENQIEILEYKYLEVLDTLTSVTEHLVRLTGLLLPTNTIEGTK